MTGRQQLHGLTIARGLAAWLVVLFHIRSGIRWLLPAEMMTVIDKGYLAVDFFFLLSGFVIYLSAHKAFMAEGWRATPAFLQRRLARIYPLHIFMLALTLAFVLILTATDRSTKGYPWEELPLHILLMQNWGFTDKLSWNHPAWSISTEMVAYMLFPLLMLATPLARAPRWALAASIAGAAALLAFWLDRAGLPHLGANITGYGLVRCLFEFSAGAMLCALWLKMRDNAALMKTGTIIAIAVMAGAGWAWSMQATRELWAFPIMTASVIFLLAQLPIQGNAPAGCGALPLRGLIYLGEISYATYLSHFMLFIWFKIGFVDHPAHIPPPTVAFYLALTFLLSVLLYHLVEKPGRRLFSPRRTTATAAVATA